MLVLDWGRHSDQDKSYSGARDFPRKRTAPTPNLANRKCRKPAMTAPVGPYTRAPIALWKYRRADCSQVQIFALRHDKQASNSSTDQGGGKRRPFTASARSERARYRANNRGPACPARSSSALAQIGFRAHEGNVVAGHIAGQLIRADQVRWFPLGGEVSGCGHDAVPP